MFESNPFHLMYTAVTRRTKEDDLIGGDQAITVDQALYAMTMGAAWQIRMDDRLGSITTGKYADLVVLDRDPRTTPMKEFREIRVLQTIVNGNSVDLEP